MAKQVFSAGIIVFHEQNGNRLYLVLHYSHGHWGFAKGKLEEDEDQRAAAIRELHEETGLRAHIVSGFENSFSYDYIEKDGIFSRKTVTFFVGKVDSMSVTLSDEHHDYAWLSYEDALQRLTYDNAKDALRKVKQFLY